MAYNDTRSDFNFDIVIHRLLPKSTTSHLVLTKYKM